MLCSFPAKRLFRGYLFLIFIPVLPLAGFSVCTSLISGLTCDLGGRFRPNLRFRFPGPSAVSVVCISLILCLHKSGIGPEIGVVQTQNQTYTDTEPRLCRPESTSVFRQFLRGRLRRSTVRTPKWDPHQERPESVRITRITLSVTISETTTILIANFTGPST